MERSLAADDGIGCGINRYVKYLSLNRRQQSNVNERLSNFSGNLAAILATFL